MDLFGGFSVPQRSRLTPQENEKVAASFAEIKAAETKLLAEYPANLHDQVQQAFWFSAHQAREYGIALHSGDEDPLQSATPHDNQISALEIRAALRTSVAEGSLTQEQASNLTWDRVNEMVEASGKSLVGLTEEILASAVYVPEAPRYAPVTEDDLALDISRIRAAKDRRVEMLQVATWESLKAHLESIFQQLSTDAEMLHQRDSFHPLSSPPEFHGIATLLSRMPKRFRRQAFCQCLSGQREFMRTLVMASGDTARPDLKASPVRVSMNVQARKPDQGFWVLTWKNSLRGEWEFRLPSSPDELKRPRTILDFDLQQLKESADVADVAAVHFLSLVMWNVPDRVSGAWWSSKATREAVGSDFAPMISHGSNAWADALRLARATFGWDLESKTVFKLMGLSKAGEYDELHASWKYPLSGAPLDPIAPRKLGDLFRKMSGPGRSPASHGIEPLSAEALADYARLIGVSLD